MVSSSFTDREQRLLAMGKMAATLAHEIRNPLGSMELYCSLLRKDLTEQPANLKLVEAILRGIRTLDHIVANSLQFARDLRVNPHVIEDPKQYLQETLEYISPIAQTRGVSIILKDNCPSATYADAPQLQQVLINLIRNAIDAYPEHINDRIESQELAHSSEVCISSTTTENNQWQIQITDYGAGISPENLDTIFDPFFTTKPNGTGLGMSVAYAIIKAHGGELSVDSELHRGTSVTILLPSKEDDT